MSNTPSNNEDAGSRGFLTVKEASRWASVSEKTMKRWIERGLPRYQAGPKEKVLIRPTDIELFLTRKQAPAVDVDTMVKEVLADLAVTCK
jgi:hypothetical protein